MQNRKPFYSLFTVTLLGLFLISCGNQAKKEEHAKEDSKKIEVPQSYEGNPTIQAYLKLKDGLVLSDSKKARIHAKELVASLENPEEGSEIESIKKHAMTIYESEDLETQREAFEPLSDSIAALASRQDMGVKLYRQYCPMAFENAGAFWLSTEEEIFNPYFGDKMLHCGVVKEEI